MPIKIQIREVAEKHGLKNPYQLRIKANLAPATATRCFSNDLTLITMDTLTKLCDALKCEPGDILKTSKTR